MEEVVIKDLRGRDKQFKVSTVLARLRALRICWYIVTFQVIVKFTGNVVQCGDLERVIGDPAQRMGIIQALDLVLSQGAILKPE